MKVHSQIKVGKYDLFMTKVINIEFLHLTKTINLHEVYVILLEWF